MAAYTYSYTQATYGSSAPAMLEAVQGAVPSVEPSNLVLAS